MSETSRPTSLTPEQIQQSGLRVIRQLAPVTINHLRNRCANGTLDDMRRAEEARRGPGTFPSTPAFCLTTLDTMIRERNTAGLYNMMVPEGQSNAPLVRAIRAAAREGQTTYTDPSGPPRPLSCGLALDQGATAGATIPDRINQPNLSGAEIQAVARACYTPGTTHITVEGQSLPATQAGLMAGELIGQRTVRSMVTEAADILAFERTSTSIIEGRERSFRDAQQLAQRRGTNITPFLENNTSLLEEAAVARRQSRSLDYQEAIGLLTHNTANLWQHLSQPSAGTTPAPTPTPTPQRTGPRPTVIRGN